MSDIVPEESLKLSFCLTFSDEVGETQLPIPALRRSPCVEKHPYSLRGFDGRAGSETTMGHVFIWGVMAAVTFVGGRGRDEGARQRSQGEPGLFLCSAAIIALSLGWGGVPRCLNQEALRIRPSWFSSIYVCALSISNRSTFTPEGSSTGASSGVKWALVQPA